VNDGQQTRSIEPNEGDFSISILHQMIIPLICWKKWSKTCHFNNT